MYVALTCAILGLVCNRDLARLLTSESYKQLEIEVGDHHVGLGWTATTRHVSLTDTTGLADAVDALMCC